ncbi:MAG: phage tail protein [Calditrichaeota bacterium]|nr:phage tail protein [Calditrichota bacterium]MCB9088576.1 phage tail protein [Calditrichia bacterium]MCB0288628.1 phage tail protein [Calditrichota bacterium]MCB0294143.1 phage tail protein [Calditrichota bacterium]MCB0302448.1 phage tail protein [Calditrichota bacterium]
MARTDPYFAFRFRIVIEGIIEGGFTELSGLQATTLVEDFKEGGVNNYVHKLPKETTYENLVLKKGLADQDTLWKWHRDVVAGKIKRTTVQIMLLKDRLANPSDAIAYTWSFKDAYPVKWSGPDLKADGNTVAFESIEIAHHGFV